MKGKLFSIKRANEEKIVDIVEKLQLAFIIYP